VTIFLTEASMSRSIQSTLLQGAVIALAAIATVARAADDQAQGGRDPAKVIVQSGAPSGVPVDVAAPPLHLSDAQRTRIREVLNTKHTDVSLEVKENQGAKSFEPRIGETIPKSLKGEAFPQPLISEIPETKRFTYLKFKDQVLIVDPLNRKIVDMFPETKG
jgi:hypothetical protein